MNVVALMALLVDKDCHSAGFCFDGSIPGQKNI